jgi:hypothetical protein
LEIEGFKEPPSLPANLSHTVKSQLFESETLRVVFAETLFVLRHPTPTLSPLPTKSRKSNQTRRTALVCLRRKEAYSPTVGGSSPSLVAVFSVFGGGVCRLRGLRNPLQPAGKPRLLHMHDVSPIEARAIRQPSGHFV